MNSKIFRIHIVTLCTLFLTIQPLWSSDLIQQDQTPNIIAESEIAKNDLQIVLKTTNETKAMGFDEGSGYYQIDFKKPDGSFLSKQINLEGMIYQNQLAKHVGWINDSLFYTYSSGRANSYYSVYSFDQEDHAVYIRPLFSGCVHWHILCKVEKGQFKLYIDGTKLLITYPPQSPE